MSKAVIVSIVIVLLIVILVFLRWGSAASYGSIPIPPYERFEDAGAAANVLTAQERELFEDIKANKLSQDDIKKLIVDGKLTDDIINKFLKHMDFPPIVMKSKETKEDFADNVQPYACEDMYVGKPQSWTSEARWWDGSPVLTKAETGAPTAPKSRGTCSK
jgi:hypothetical protein